MRACGSQDEATCGPWNNWSFTASDAPEPMSPYDPDWEGGEKIGNIAFEGLELNWCTITFKSENPLENAQHPLSFLLKFYILENNEEKCHPEFKITETECEENLILPNLNVELYPDQLFSDANFGYFTKGHVYAWEVAACKDISYSDCTGYSQKWRFAVEDFLIDEPSQVYPSGSIPVGLPVTFQWGIAPGAKSYVYSINGVAQGMTTAPSVTFDYPKLNLNTTYTWKTKSCQDYNGEICENSWSDTLSFKTTGQAPSLIYPKGENIPIPIKFQWEEVPGAKSYVFKLQGTGIDEEIITEETTLSFDYPNLKQEVNYTWKVKTCARSKGELCGNYSSQESFKTFRLSAPGNLSPKNNDSFFTYQINQIISWEAKERNYFQYKVSLVNLSSGEINQSCNVGDLIPETITVDSHSIPLKLICLGDYRWKVRACLDENCQDPGDWSEEYNFSFIQKEKPKEIKGLVPCGRAEDNPDTDWNEREDCQIKHIFLLIRNLIDFILWTVGPLMLGMLVLGTGIMFYLSIKFQDSLFLTRIKLIWKYAGIGYGILFFSWTILNLFLRLIGFQIGIFGNWWTSGF